MLDEWDVEHPHPLTGSWRKANTDDERAKYRAEMRSYIAGITERIEKLEKFRGSIPQYQDIVRATQFIGYNEVIAKIRVFAEVFDAVRDAFASNVQIIMAPHLSGFQDASFALAHWRNTARSALVEMRQMISP